MQDIDAVLADQTERAGWRRKGETLFQLNHLTNVKRDGCRDVSARGGWVDGSVQESAKQAGTLTSPRSCACPPLQSELVASSLLRSAT